MLLRLYRAGVLILLLMLVHQQARWFDQQRTPSISLRQARKYFRQAHKIQLRDPEHGLYYVTDSYGDTLGCLLTTSPDTDGIVGYSGPNNLLIALDVRGAIVGLELLRSGDTDEHVLKVRQDRSFLSSFMGWKPSQSPPPKVSAVSGATLTSSAIAEGVQQRLAGAAPSLRFPDPVSLAEVQGIFTNAARIVPDKLRLRVLDASGILLGFALRTSPQTDNVSGYRGPTECLAGLRPDGRTIAGIRLRKSYDTDSYVAQLRQSERFLRQFSGRSIEEIAALNARGRDSKVEAISGATMTSRAVSEGLKLRLASELKGREPVAAWKPKTRDWSLAGVVAGSLVMAFTPLRGRRWVRTAWQVLLIGGVGLISHDFLSLALLGGWASHGLAWKAAPGMIALAGAALIIPWSTRRQIYCHQICPHGAAQQLLGGLVRWRWTVPHKWSARLEYLPGLLLFAALLALLAGWKMNLANFEAFDAWVWRVAGWPSVVLAVLGLALSLVIPQAYCRFGCPTGALLGFIRSSGSADRWNLRDWAALGILAVSVLTVATVRVWPRTEPEPEPALFRGKAMGTTWSLKMFDEVADPFLMEKDVGGQFEWVESLTSHWRTNTDIWQFNHAPETDPFPVPWPVLTLSRWSAEISRLTDGAFDITVGPLVRLWGFGPGPKRSQPPTDAEIAAVLPSIGWQKLDVQDGTLQKQNPALEIDLSSIAEGWSADQVAELLERRGYTNFLVEIGGELRARGRWTVAIEHPMRSCTITNESLSTSGTYRQNFKTGKKEFSHLINPRTGRPVTHNTVSVSVRHPSCGRADAWSTALNVMGVETGLPLAEKLNLAAQFVIQRSPGDFILRQSSAWTAREKAAAPPAAK